MATECWETANTSRDGKLRATGLDSGRVLGISRLARAADQFRPSDVTFWGIVALCCGGLAVISASLSAVVPPNVLAGLHASRLEGGTLNQLRSQVANLQADANALKRDNDALLTRFLLAEQRGSDVAQRIGAIEVTIPNLLEAAGDNIDRGSVTASIGDDGSVTYETDGGIVTVQRTPLTADVPAQAMPPLPAPPPRADGDAYGVALGAVIDPYGAPATWAALNARVGTLLIGLTPLLADQSDGTGKRLVAGPLPGFAQARELCGHLAPVGIPCVPVPFVGTPLAP